MKNSGQAKKFSLKERLQSFKPAYLGLVFLLREEHNMRIHLLAALTAVILGFVFDLQLAEWSLIIFAIGLVLSAEAFNTAIESLSDKIQPDYDEEIKRVKDVSAGAVLIASITSFVIGGLVFIPYLLSLFEPL